MKSREPRVVVNARVDIRHLAGIALYLNKNNRTPTTRSDLIHASISILHALLSAEGQVTPIDSIEEAVATLGALGLTFRYGSQGHKDIVQQLQTQGNLADSLNTIMHEADDRKKLEDELKEQLKKMALNEKIPPST